MTATAPPTADPVNRPSHYVGRDGTMSIDVTEAYRLGPHLTQAVDYILRAGRKSLDPRQDLAKARWYLDRAAKHGRDLTFGHPTAARPSPRYVADNFGVNSIPLAKALGLILAPYPQASCCERAAELVAMEIVAPHAQISEDAR